MGFGNEPFSALSLPQFKRRMRGVAENENGDDERGKQAPDAVGRESILHNANAKPIEGDDEHGDAGEPAQGGEDTQPFFAPFFRAAAIVQIEEKNQQGNEPEQDGCRLVRFQQFFDACNPACDKQDADHGDDRINPAAKLHEAGENRGHDGVVAARA